MLQLAGNLCAPHQAFHKLQSIVLVGLDFCKAHAGVRCRRRSNFSETPPPIHLATADKPGFIIVNYLNANDIFNFVSFILIVGLGDIIIRIFIVIDYDNLQHVTLYTV